MLTKSKRIILISFSALLVFFALSAASAIFIMKKQIDSEQYRYLMFGISALSTLFICILFAKKQNAFLCALPLLLISPILSVVFKSIGVNIFVNMLIVLAMSFVYSLMQNKRKQNRTRNIHQIRRNYEKLRKK